jgi:hypothetical protein
VLSDSSEEEMPRLPDALKRTFTGMDEHEAYKAALTFLASNQTLECDSEEEDYQSQSSESPEELGISTNSINF